MTDDAAVRIIANHARVIAAHSKPDAGGVLRPPGPAELQQIARDAMTTAIGALLLNNAVGRAFLEDEYTLSVTSGTTEYALPENVARVINVRAASDGQPLRAFASTSDFDDWRWNQYGDTSTSGLDPAAWYPSGRSGLGRVQITFYPGVGSETSMYVRYVKVIPEPYTINTFPASAHPVVLVNALNHASGGAFQRDAEILQTQLVQNLNVATGGSATMRPSSLVMGVIRRYNALVGRSSSASVYYGKDRL